MSFASHLQERRKEMIVAIRRSQIIKMLAKKNMSQNWFAYKVGVSSGYMSQLMLGSRNPSPKLREKILTTLKLDENGFNDVFQLKG